MALRRACGASMGISNSTRCNGAGNPRRGLDLGFWPLTAGGRRSHLLPLRDKHLGSFPRPFVDSNEASQEVAGVQPLGEARCPVWESSMREQSTFKNCFDAQI